MSYALLCAAVLAFGVAGCQQPIQPESPTGSSITADDLDSAWDAALWVLHRHDFETERQDRALGHIETLPVTSQYFTEFWRSDVADAYSRNEATLHTIRRKAAVQFVRREGTGEWTVQVQVDVYRLSLPERQVTSSSSAIQSFSGVLPTAEGVPASKSRDWVHLGRDAAMEQLLLDQILQRAGAAELS